MSNILLDPILVPLLVMKRERNLEIGEEMTDNIVQNVLRMSEILYDIFVHNEDKVFVFEKKKEYGNDTSDYHSLEEEMRNIQERIVKKESNKIDKSYLPKQERTVENLYKLLVVSENIDPDELKKLKNNKDPLKVATLFKNVFDGANGKTVFSFDIDNVRKAVYLMSDADIVSINKKIVNAKETVGRRFFWTIQVHKNLEKFLIERIEELVEHEIQNITLSFVENPNLYYCDLCERGKIYTYDEMIEVDGCCPFCTIQDSNDGGMQQNVPLSLMTDHDKVSAVTSFVDGLPEYFRNDRKKEILSRLLLEIVPDLMESDGSLSIGYVDDDQEEVIDPVIEYDDVVVDFSSCILPEEAEDMLLMMHFPSSPVDLGIINIERPFFDLNFENIIDKDSAISLLSIPSFSTFSLQGFEIVPVSTVDGPVYEPSFFTIEDIKLMDKQQLADMIMTRWLFATIRAIESLKKGKQSMERKEMFSVENIFNFDSMSRKYIVKAIHGSYSRKIAKALYSKIDPALNLLQREGKILLTNNYQISLTGGGIEHFLSECYANRVYLFDDHREKIERAKKNYYNPPHLVKERRSDSLKTKIFSIFDDIHSEIVTGTIECGKSLFDRMVQQFMMVYKDEDDSFSLNEGKILENST